MSGLYQQLISHLPQFKCTWVPFYDKFEERCGGTSNNDDFHWERCEKQHNTGEQFEQWEGIMLIMKIKADGTQSGNFYCINESRKETRKGMDVHGCSHSSSFLRLLCLDLSESFILLAWISSYLHHDSKFWVCCLGLSIMCFTLYSGGTFLLHPRNPKYMLSLAFFPPKIWLKSLCSFHWLLSILQD